MSFSGLVQQGLKNVYTTLPHTVGAASVSAGISYLASRATTRVSLPSPLVAAKFTAAIALVRVIAGTLEHIFNDKLSNDKLSNYTVLVCGSIGANALLNTDGTRKTAAKLGFLTHGSEFLYDKFLSKHVKKVLTQFSDISSYSSRNSSLNTVAFEGLKKIYEELPQTILATAAAGFLCRYVSLIGLNPKTAMTFTVATAALRGANAFIEYYFAETERNNLTNTILMSGLTMGAKHHYSHLQIPGYLAIGKAYGIALLAIESSGLLVPRIRKILEE